MGTTSPCSMSLTLYSRSSVLRNCNWLNRAPLQMKWVFNPSLSHQFFPHPVVATLSSCYYNFPPLPPSPNTLPINNPRTVFRHNHLQLTPLQLQVVHSVWPFLRQVSKGFWDSRNRFASTLNTSMKVFRGRELREPYSAQK